MSEIGEDFEMLRFRTTAASATLSLKYVTYPGNPICIHDVRCGEWDFQTSVQNLSNPEVAGLICC